MAAQFTEMKGLPLRRDFRCTWRATISLPEPLSPVIRIEASEGATCSAMLMTAFIAASSAIIGRLSSETAASTAADAIRAGGE